jgi:hypothetical protein
MKQTMLKTANDLTPALDKLFALVGAGTAISITHLNAVIGLLVGVLTLALLVPRVIMAWRALLVKRGDIPVEDLIDPEELEERLAKKKRRK